MGAFDLPEYPTDLRALEDTKRGEKWARRALEAEAAIVAGAMNGTRNTTLNNAALKLGHKVASGYLQAAEVEAALMEAAPTVGACSRGWPRGGARHDQERPDGWPARA